MKAASILPTPRTIAQQVVITLVVTLAMAWIVGHTPALRAWLQNESAGKA